MTKDTKYIKGYKGKGMCKYCTECFYCKTLRKNWCHFWLLNIRQAVWICKGIRELKQKAA